MSRVDVKLQLRIANVNAASGQVSGPCRATTYMGGLRPRRSSRRPAERLQPTQRRHRLLDSTLRLPRPQRVPQRVDAEVGGGGLGAKRGQLSDVLVAARFRGPCGRGYGRVRRSGRSKGAAPPPSVGRARRRGPRLRPMPLIATPPRWRSDGTRSGCDRRRPWRAEPRLRRARLRAQSAPSRSAQGDRKDIGPTNPGLVSSDAARPSRTSASASRRSP